MMKRKVISFLFIAISVFSCSPRVYIYSNVEEVKTGADNNISVLNRLACEVRKKKYKEFHVRKIYFRKIITRKKTHKEFYFRKIIWNNSCNCGLVDVSIKMRAPVYYPYLITKNQEIIPLIPIGTKRVNIDTLRVDSLYLKFKNDHLNLFTEKEFQVMDARIEIKVVFIGFSIISSNIFTGDTDILDSLYSKKLKYEYKFSCKKKLMMNK